MIERPLGHRRSGLAASIRRTFISTSISVAIGCVLTVRAGAVGSWANYRSRPTPASQSPPKQPFNV